jgi:DNA gyrase subunit B
MSKKYTANDIEVLSDYEHVIKRIGVYAGSNSSTTSIVPTFVDDKFNLCAFEYVPAAWKLIQEIIDNAVDEIKHLPNQKNRKIIIEADCDNGTYSVEDNGRGVPIDIHPQVNKHTPEVVFGSLRSGRNFKDDEKLTGVIGTNGMGSALTCFCSEQFNITIYRDGKRYKQTFENGKPKPPKIIDAKQDSGTTIEFKLNPAVLTSVVIPEQMIHSRTVEQALLNPGVTFVFKGKDQIKHTYRFKKGFDEFFGRDVDSFTFTSDTTDNHYSFTILTNLYQGDDEQIFTWNNGSLLYDGGICNTQFFNAFCDKVIDHLKREAKRNDCEVTKNDIRVDMLIIGNLLLKKPEYDSQTKSRLVGPNLKKDFESMIESMWSAFARKNKQWLDNVLNKAIERHHEETNKKALKDHKKQLSKKVAGLTDANGRDRDLCKLLIVEGLSAGSQITDVRNPKTTAVFPLTGKILNTYGCRPADILKNDKISDLLASIGLIPGHEPENLRYGKIVISVDADYDGGNIAGLLVTLFYNWKQLFTKECPRIFKLDAPNIIAVKGNNRVYFATRQEYENVKDKYKSWEIRYIKGLGSLERVDWETIIDDDKYLIVVWSEC